jgi:hypothetical protein
MRDGTSQAFAACTGPRLAVTVSSSSRRLRGRGCWALAAFALPNRRLLDHLAREGQHLSLSARAWCVGHQLARRAGHPPRGGEPQGLGRRPHLGRGRHLAGSGQRAAHCQPARPRPRRAPCPPGRRWDAGADRTSSVTTCRVASGWYCRQRWRWTKRGPGPGGPIPGRCRRGWRPGRPARCACFG